MKVLRSRARFLLLLLPTIPLWRGLTSFFYPDPAARFSDITIAHYPYAVYIRQMIAEYGAFPLWNRLILSGAPLVANPLTSVFYPPHWLSWVLPLPFGFNFLVILHLIFGGVGMYVFLRTQNLSDVGALVGGVAFAGLPKFYSHYGAGHLTLLYAIPWTPWLLAASSAQFRHSRWGTRLRFAPGMILALIFVADPRWAAYAGLLWFAWLIFGNPSPDLRAIKPLWQNIVAAGFLAAPLIFPMGEYLRLSSRAELASGDALAGSLPLSALFGLIFPGIAGDHEWMGYLGAVGWLFVLLALVLPKRAGTRFWLGVFLVSLLLALGDHLPLVPLLYRLPGLNLLRVPARMLFVVGVACTILVGYGFDALWVREPGLRQRKRWGTLVLFAALVFVLSLAFGIKILTGHLPEAMEWGTLMTVFAVTTLWGAWSQRWVLGFVFVLMLMDVSGAASGDLAPRQLTDVLQEGRAETLFLFGQSGAFRTYSPSYSLPQHSAAFYGLALADGVDPLQLAAYVAWMDVASGVPRAGYGVTIPPFAGDPYTANASYLPDPDTLGMLNVRFVFSAFPLDVNGLELAATFPGTWVYENLLAKPPAWMAASGDGVRVVLTPNRIHAQTTQAGQVIFAEVAYPGWQAYVDGARVPLETAEGLFRAVTIGEGEHDVVLVYRPLSLYLGLGLWLVWMVLVVFFWRRNDV